MAADLAEPHAQSRGNGQPRQASDAGLLEQNADALELFLSRCKGQLQSMPEQTATAAFQTIRTLALARVKDGKCFTPDAIPVLLEVVAAWGSRNGLLAMEALLLLSEVYKFLNARLPLPASLSPSSLALHLSRLQHGAPEPRLKASVLRTLLKILQTCGVRACDDNLQEAVELILAALSPIGPEIDAATRLSILVFAVDCLSPLSDAPHTFPKLASDHAASLSAAARSVALYLQRGSLDHSNSQDRASNGPAQEAIRVQEHHVLIFFGTLPRLQIAFGKSGTAFVDAVGDTVAHMLVEAGLHKCLDMYLHSCPDGPTTELRNAAGLTLVEAASMAGRKASLNVVKQHTTSRVNASGQAGDPASRAIARSLSVPLPPSSQAETSNSRVPSLSWVEPDSSAAEEGSMTHEERLQKFEAQAGLSAPHSSSPTPPVVSTSKEERKRILQLALAQLEGHRGGQGSGALPSTLPTYLQNPVGSVPVHSNPFAGFNEIRHGEATGRDATLTSEQMQFSVPQLSLGALRSSSTGSIGMEGTSPPQEAKDFGPRSLDDGGRSGSGGKRASDWESSTTPSTRMWLGNIAAHVTVRSLYDVFGRFGQLTDAAVFPARIGPLGYAFVNFLEVTDAARSYEALNNTAVPPLTGTKLLKIRYKPAQQQPKPLGESLDVAVTQPSNHLWLGNVLTRPNKAAIEDLFSRFGTLTSVRVFPGKTFAFVNYNGIAEAANAMHQLDGRSWQLVSGSKPMVVRYQTGPQLGLPLQDALGLRAASVPGMFGGAPLVASPFVAPQPNFLAANFQLPTAAALGGVGSLPGLRHTSLPVLPMPPMPLPEATSEALPNGLSLALAGLESQSSLGLDADGLLPAINLSNRLNPNNMHYDRELADLYKNMNKAEKEALWADDRSCQHLLAMQDSDQLPADISILGLPAQQASLLANHLAGGAGDPWQPRQASDTLAPQQQQQQQQGLWGSTLGPQDLLGSAHTDFSNLSLLQGQPSGTLPGLTAFPARASPTASSTNMQQLINSYRPPTSLAEALSLVSVCQGLQQQELRSQSSTSGCGPTIASSLGPVP